MLNCVVSQMSFFLVFKLNALILFSFVFQGHRLKFIEEEVLEQLAEQIRLHSESVISDLERAIAELKPEPQDLHDLSNYALMVQKLFKPYILE